MTRQCTLATAVSLSGVGVHTGASCRLTLRPCAPDSGRLFRVGNLTVPARADFVVDTARCTVLGVEGARISTVEHILSALFACSVDNALMELEGPEIPILDGSALPFIDAIKSVGIVEQDAEAAVLKLEQEVACVTGATTLKGTPSGGFDVKVTTTFDDWHEGSATIGWRSGDAGISSYQTSIAPARTFAFRQEVEALLRAGLAKGGSLDNVLIITPPWDFSSPLRLSAEWCAHKLLDVVGDLALVGTRLEMRVDAVRPGHRANTRFAAELLKLRLAQGVGRKPDGCDAGH